MLLRLSPFLSHSLSVVCVCVCVCVRCVCLRVCACVCVCAWCVCVCAGVCVCVWVCAWCVCVFWGLPSARHRDNAQTATSQRRAVDQTTGRHNALCGNVRPHRPKDGTSKLQFSGSVNDLS